ncbi:MAG: YbaB/EbfC family nucleoid-associated protein [Gammaproteobacteria bacterium]|nr:YbaB/EbfC family nucleoid-associated protein [Gammaproteobacteria bacterium]
MKGGINQLMKQAQAMQENMQRAQEELGTTEVTGEAGGGMVSVRMTCRYEVKRVTLEDALVRDDKEMIEDLLAAAVNDAVRKVEATIQEKFSGMTSGMGLPAGLKLPF